MIQFLAKHLIKNYQDITSPPVRRAYGVLCGCVGVALNLLLFAGKLLAGINQTERKKRHEIFAEKG